MAYKGKGMRRKLPKVAEMSVPFSWVTKHGLIFWPGLQIICLYRLPADFSLISLPLDRSPLLFVNGSYLLLRPNIWNNSSIWALLSFPIVVILQLLILY